MFYYFFGSTSNMFVSNKITSTVAVGCGSRDQGACKGPDTVWFV